MQERARVNVAAVRNADLSVAEPALDLSFFRAVMFGNFGNKFVENNIVRGARHCVEIIFAGNFERVIKFRIGEGKQRLKIKPARFGVFGGGDCYA